MNQTARRDIAPTLATAVLIAFAGPASAQAKGYSDNFAILNELNKASTVMVTETGIVPRPLGARIAQGLAKVIEDGEKPGAKRPGDYPAYEPLLIAQAGPDATRMHSGRSRQDILPATRRMMLRERSLDAMQALNDSRGVLLAMAERHAATIVPGYTNGVQAQPTTYGHYLLGFGASFERDAERFRQAWARLNLNPLGVAAFGTSSFAIDRPRLAQLLGFDGNVENGYDAAQISTIDVNAELNAVASIAALKVGAFVEDIHTQYHQVVPWLLITEGALTHTSSLMPQKRNPTILNSLRLTASTVIGDAHVFTLQAHNVNLGMPDYKREQTNRTLEGATTMFGQVKALLENLQVNPARALAEVNAEYSTTTEVADVLQREADIPFRVGHHFASELVSFGRAQGLGPQQLKFDDVKRIWTEAGKKYDVKGPFPLTEKRFLEALSPEGMIAAAKGLGGPQPAEVSRMLAAQRKQLAADQAWLKETRERLAKSQQALDAAFKALAAGG